MFVAMSAEPWDSDAELLTRTTQPAKFEVNYRVRLRNVHRGALRVLSNLLVARIPDLVRIETAQVPTNRVGPPLDFARLEYPPAVGKAPFSIEYETPVRNSRNRSIQIAFARSPDSNALETIYSGLSTWSQLPLFGGYPHPGMKPWQSSADPSPPFLLDPQTVEQAFPDLFLCDDDCYACVANWARYVHRSVCPVAGIVFR
jgi:hypothetical protein